MVIEKHDNELILKEKDIIIEEYKFDEEINFDGLMKYLLSKNLKEKIEFNPDLTMFNETDTNLINIIIYVISEYNKNVEEFNKFILEHSEWLLTLNIKNV